MTTDRLALSVVTLISSFTLSLSGLQAAPPDDKGMSGSGKKNDNNGINVDLGLSASISAGMYYLVRDALPDSGSWPDQPMIDHIGSLHTV